MSREEFLKYLKSGNDIQILYEFHKLKAQKVMEPVEFANFLNQCDKNMSIHFELDVITELVKKTFMNQFEVVTVTDLKTGRILANV